MTTREENCYLCLINQTSKLQIQHVCLTDLPPVYVSTGPHGRQPRASVHLQIRALPSFNEACYSSTKCTKLRKIWNRYRESLCYKIMKIKNFTKRLGYPLVTVSGNQHHRKGQRYCRIKLSKSMQRCTNYNSYPANSGAIFHRSSENTRKLHRREWRSQSPRHTSEHESDALTHHQRQRPRPDSHFTRRRNPQHVSEVLCTAH